ncbi:MAG: hypothetical protein ABI142_07680, partial [Bryocella sp.]
MYLLLPLSLLLLLSLPLLFFLSSSQRICCTHPQTHPKKAVILSVAEGPAKPLTPPTNPTLSN